MKYPSRNAFRKFFAKNKPEEGTNHIEIPENERVYLLGQDFNLSLTDLYKKFEGKAIDNDATLDTYKAEYFADTKESIYTADSLTTRANARNFIQHTQYNANSRLKTSFLPHSKKTKQPQ